MESFADYARRIVSSLSPAHPFPNDQYQSPLEEPLSRLCDEHFNPFAINPLDPQLDDANLKNALNPEEIWTVESAILGTGLECMAFYKSIRYQAAPPIPGFWGIFIFDYAISYLAHEIENYYHGTLSTADSLKAAVAFLYFHERFHFRFDAWAISQESATGKPLYEDYRNGVYRSWHPDNEVYEETLANLHALESIQSFGVHAFCKEFVKSQPGAYSNIQAETQEEFLARLAAQLFYSRNQIMGFPQCRLPEHIGYIANHSSPAILDKQCPVHLLKGISAQSFLVPNISLPKLSEIEKGFLTDYLQGEEIRTDHKYFKIDNGEKIKCPNPHSKTVRLYEFKNIVGKAGLRTNEYFEQRQKTDCWRKDVPRLFVKKALI